MYHNLAKGSLGLDNSSNRFLA